MDEIGRTVFKDIYPYLAEQIKADYGIVEGRCLDAGAGPGHLAIALGRITRLNIDALDLDPEALAIAKANIASAGLSDRVRPVEGNVEKLPYPDDSIDLIVSRGSYPFWKDKVKAFAELKRVLKPGGRIFVGGGMGNLIPPAERTRIQDIMAARKIGPPKELEVSIQEMGAILRRAGFGEFKIATDSGCLCGLWVDYRKPAAGAPEGR
jgi:SAM-dependent methyltransferase